MRTASLLLLIALAPACTGRLALAPEDGVTVLEQRVRLSAKLVEERGTLELDVADAELEFRLGDQVARGRTDSDGVAFGSVCPLTTGALPYLAQLEGGPRTWGRLWVFERTRPVVVCDIDGTLCDMSGVGVLVVGHRAPTFPGAPELLRELAETHGIVYLSARDRAFGATTRVFLARHGFPEGPLLLNAWGLDEGEERAQLLPGNHGAFKARVLRSLKERGLRLVLGIGDTPTDAEAYEAAGIQSYIRGALEIPAPSLGFGSYAELRERLAAARVLPE